MSDLTITVDDAKISEGTSAKGAWKRIVIKDGNGEYYSSFETGLFEPALGLKGQRAVISWEQDGKYKTLKSIRPAEKEPGEKLGTGEYVRGQSAQPDARRGLSQTAWNCAARMAQAELGYEAAKHIADRIFEDLLRKNGLMSDEDIPF